MNKNYKIIVAAVSFILGLAVFTIAYIGATQHTGLGIFNQPVLDWMVARRSPELTAVAKFVTNIAGPLILASIVAVIVLVWAIAKREIWRPFLLASSMGVTALLSTVLKSLFMDVRPPQTVMIPTFEIDYSFPSGHTVGIAVLLLVIGYLIYSRNFTVPKFISWISVALIGTGLIAVSRLYLGYHWLTDVAASVGLSLIILSAVIIIDRLAKKHFRT